MLMKKLFIKTHGCQMNFYDSERMTDLLKPHGYQLDDNEDDADLIVLNTCHIREKAVEKTYSELGRIRDKIKTRKSNTGKRSIVVVAGWAIARQHPRGHSGTVFVTIEDETSDVQLIIWPKIFNEFKSIIRNPLMLIKGRISQWDSSISIEVDSIDKISVDTDLPPVHDWH